MAKPRGMYLRNSTWHARKDVPKPLVEIIGRTSLQKSLETSDLADAKARFHGVMQQFEVRIADAWRTLRQEPRPEQPVEIVLDLGPGWKLPDMRTTDQKVKALLEQANLVPADKEPLSMLKLFEQWKAERQPSQNTGAEYGRFMDTFLIVCGELPVAAYTVEHARKWKQHVVALPDLAHSTREKWFGSIRTLFKFADRNEYLRADPFAKIVLEKPNPGESDAPTGMGTRGPSEAVQQPRVHGSGPTESWSRRSSLLDSHTRALARLPAG
jgi:hypothetical protein